MIQGYSHLLLATVDELLDIYLKNLYLYHSWKMKSSFKDDIKKEIDFRFMSYVELAINVPDVIKFRQTILEHTIQFDAKNWPFGIDSNPILGKAIRLLFDQLHSKKKVKGVFPLYRSIYDEWEPTCYQKN